MRISLVIIMLLLGLVVDTSAQEEQAGTFNRERWQEITKDIDYSPDKEIENDEKKDKKSSQGESRKPSSNGGSLFPFGGQALQIIVITVFIVILIIVISKLVGNNLRLRHKDNAGTIKESLEEIEENLMESDLMKWLKKVVEEKNYRLALRIYYLIIIKELATKGLISWRKEKTNLDYLYEMRDHHSFSQFEEVTGIYQLIWYGEKNMGDKYLLEMSHKFRSYYQSINQLADG